MARSRAPATDDSSAPTVVVAGDGEWRDRIVPRLRDDGVEVIPTSTADGVRTRIENARIDCVVTDLHLPEEDGVELVRSLREDHPTLPIVVATDDGSERAASEAIRAGADEYLRLTAPEDESASRTAADGELPAIVREVVAEYRTRAADRARARRFESAFADPGTMTWVLDPDGTVRRCNEPARELTARPDTAVAGEPLWAISPWSDGDLRERARTAVERATAGDRVDLEATAVVDGGERTVELSFRPVRDETGEIREVVADGTDVTERRQLEEELRASEELHRVTLNNMTDTVLITDEDGAFTYVCPNVHFIFGYTAEEIRELGTIDALLGEDLFDREELAEEGVLTNIECTATDKLGNEHALLVNVREVSIQGGTILYSCRDVTTRKRREEALTALHETTRQLVYAESADEIARIAVEETADVLHVDARAAYLFDADANALEPAAATTAMRQLHGGVSSHRLAGDTPVGRAFVKGDAAFFDDVGGATGEATEPAFEGTTDLASCAVVPLGDHGVFVVGSDERGAFDDVARELTDLLAATAEAALDRVERESRLREQERRLQEQNEQLTRLNRINGVIREIDQALVRADTRAEIERAVCERLTDDDRFRFAWIGERDGGHVRPRAWDGAEEGYLDAVEFALEGGTEPACRTAATGEPAVVANVADDLRSDAWCKAALLRDYQSVVSVPIAYDGFQYGVLAVYADASAAFDDLARAVLAELAETVASAISAAQRKRALLSGAGTRLEFETADDDFPLRRLAALADCSLSFSGGVRRTEDGVAAVATVEGAAPEHVVETAAELASIEHAEVVGEGSGDGPVRLQFSRPFVASTLADRGAILRNVTADETVARIVVDVPDEVDVDDVVAVVTDAFPDARLVARRNLDGEGGDPQSAFFDRLTDRQREVVQAAYRGGFFESPRERSGEEIAASLDISPAAFYQHNRAVQRKLFSMLFEDDDGDAAPGARG